MRTRNRRENNKQRILVATQDPGGALALLPVVKHILTKEKNCELKVLVGIFSENIFKKAGIKFTKAKGLRVKRLNYEVKKFNPDLVLTSTSYGFSVEKKILRIAQGYKIPTVSIIDYWSNYWLRFVKESEKKDSRYLPDYIVAIDRGMKKEMMAVGFPKERVKVLGNPYFESFRLFKIKTKRKEKRDYKIVFVSQPLRSIYGRKNLQTDEYSALKDILEILPQFKNKSRKISLIIRMHPKEGIEKYKKEIKNVFLNNIKIDKNTHVERLISDADLIIGINSALLFQASFSGVPVISYQPGLKNLEKDTLISNRLKLSELCRSKNDLRKKISLVLHDDYNYTAGRVLSREKKLADMYINSRVTKKIIDLILNIPTLKND